MRKAWIAWIVALLVVAVPTAAQCAAPDTPAKPTASLSGSDLVVAWDFTPAATEYRLRSSVDAGPWSTGNWQPHPQLTLPDPSPGSWIFQVQARNPDGESQWSVSSDPCVVPEPQVPGAVREPIVYVWGKDIEVTWGLLLEASEYRVRSRRNTGSWTVSAWQQQSSMVITGAEPGEWEFQVQARNAVGQGEWSQITRPVVVLPDAPATPAKPLARLSGRTIEVSWPDVPFASSYEVRSSHDGGAWVSRGLASSPMRLTAAEVGSWAFQVRAANIMGESAWSPSSDPVVVGPDPLVGPVRPVRPTLKRVTDGYTLSWEPTSGAMHYQPRLRVGAGPWNELASTTATSVTIPRLAQGTWEAQVRALNDAGASDWSDVSAPLSVRTAPKPPKTVRVGASKVLPAGFRWSTQSPKTCTVRKKGSRYRVVGKRAGRCVLRARFQGGSTYPVRVV